MRPTEHKRASTNEQANNSQREPPERNKGETAKQVTKSGKPQMQAIAGSQGLSKPPNTPGSKSSHNKSSSERRCEDRVLL
mmetsp:Transcript_148188/g.412720  ORF Transcript_148188/g.412720 Transcript_148188/m.412720 type:complete len:80 (+) Transcript_148188:131-370(+)